MGHSRAEQTSSFGQKLLGWIKAQKTKTIQCRECDADVAFSAKICSRCGASDPARVPWSAVTAICALGAAAIIAALLL